MKHGTYYASLNERQLASVWRIQKSLYGEGNSFDEHELKRWGMETWNIQGKGKFRKNTITMQIEVQKRVNHV